jgi:hypothetical protein
MKLAELRSASLRLIMLISICSPSHLQAEPVTPPATPAPPIQLNTEQEAVAAGSPVIAAIATQDLSDWRTAELADTREAYTSYLTAHPNGWFKPLALAELEPGIPADIGPRPFADVSNPNRQQSAAIATWEEQVWRKAKQIGTHTAIRGYFARVRFGRHIDEATEIFLRTRPKLPKGIPADCTFEELQLRIRVGFDLVSAYPARAIQMGLGETASGKAVVDRTGMVFAFANAQFRRPDIFGVPIYIGVLRMKYEPIRAGCLVGPPTAQIAIEMMLPSN